MRLCVCVSVRVSVHLFAICAFVRIDYNNISNKQKTGNVNSPAKLTGLQKRFVAFNGAVGETQMKWLEGILFCLLFLF